MTDKETAKLLVSRIFNEAWLQNMVIIKPVINNLVWKNQNQPPEGSADGSFNEDEWTALRDINQFLHSFECLYKTLNNG
jgi:hypothetical protein